MSGYEAFAGVEGERRAVADQLHAEMAVVLRRLGGYNKTLQELAARDPDYAPWGRCLATIGPLIAQLERHQERDLPEAVLDLTPARHGRHVVGELVVDERAGRAAYRGTELRLARLQFAALAVMARSPTHCVSELQLVQEVWGERRLLPGDGRPRNLVAGVRRALRESGAGRDELVHNLWGRGWTLTRPGLEQAGPARGGAGRDGLFPPAGREGR